MNLLHELMVHPDSESEGEGDEEGGGPAQPSLYFPILILARVGEGPIAVSV